MVQTFEEAADVVRNTLFHSYPQVKKAYIFGSFAEGRQTHHSDLDIMIEYDKAMGLAYIGLMQDIEKAAGRSVDMITVKQATELEEKFQYDILKGARSIYERPTN